ncbi:MAG: ATP-binding cassette domain-containing protein, partial [Eubacteriales bacterium]|nr:ATP-binding cassette domain-containing protein [Eubacteriales bacterium]
MIIACNNISKSFGINDILKNVTFNINEKEKVAIVGVNGAGKSTLFKIITGENNQDSGDIIISKNTTVGYFSQTLDINEENTPFNELLTVFSETIALENKLRKLEENMGKVSGEELDNLMKEYTNISNYFKENNLFNYNSKIKGVLKGLGFE